MTATPHEAPRKAKEANGAALPVEPDLAEARTFLNAWFDGCHIVTLVSITPAPNRVTKKKVVKAASFMWPAAAADAVDWVEIANRKNNVYFVVNRARDVGTKPRKTDVDAILGAHADVDPIKGRELMAERTRLLALADELADLPMPPSFIIDSGGGIQTFYQATVPVGPEYAEEVESYSRRLECVLGGVENCSNLDRVMRVPGTVNWPDAKKRAAGREPALARVLSASGRRYTWPEIVAAITALEDEPPASAEPVEYRPKANGHDRHADAGDLPDYATDAEIEALLANYPHLQAIWDGDSLFPPPDDTPSGWDNHWLASLVHEGVVHPHKLASYLRSFRAHQEESQPADERKIKDERADYVWRTVDHALRDNPDPTPPPGDCGSNGAHAPGDGEQQTAGDAKGRNQGTFKDPPKAKPFKPAGPEPWPEPGVLGEPPAAPLFPTECLPTSIRRWIEEQTESMGVPACTMAVPALVTIAGAIGKGAVLRVKVHDHGWNERPCLWGCVIMPKGRGKSPPLRIATAPLRMAEARQREKWKLEVEDWRARQPKTSKGGIKPDPNDPKPIEPKLVIADATIEAAADAMVESRGLTLIRDELSGWISNMSRYNKGSDRQFYLECYSGGPYPVDRIIRGRQIVPDVFLCVVGGLQPRVAKLAFSVAEQGVDDGFLERFGFATYPDPVPWTGVRDAPPERDWRRSVVEAVQRLAEADWSTLLQAPASDGFLHFNAEAQAIFFAWYDDHMREHVHAPGADDRPDYGFMAKAQGLVCRLAIVMHLYRWTTADGVYEPTLVDADSLERALGIFERFCRPMYKRLGVAFGTVRAHEGARRVGELIKRKKLDHIRVGIVAKMGWHGLKEREPIVEAIEALEDIDWVRRDVGSTGRRGGRPTDRWTVNPRVHE